MRLPFKQGWQLAKKALSAWSDDYAPSMGAALSYYTLFSIAPLLVIVIAIAGFFFGEQPVLGELQNDLDRIWRSPAPPARGGAFGFVRARLHAFAIILGVAFLLMVSLA